MLIYDASLVNNSEGVIHSTKKIAFFLKEALYIAHV